MRISRNTCLPEQTEELLANLRKAQGLWIPSKTPAVQWHYRQYRQRRTSTNQAEQ